MQDPTKRKTVFTVVERNQPNSEHKSVWIRIGSGWVNSDGSINLKLDALPVNGQLQVRQWESKEESDARRAAAAARVGSPPNLLAE